jgi:hypothetical protein
MEAFTVISLLNFIWPFQQPQLEHRIARDASEADECASDISQGCDRVKKIHPTANRISLHNRSWNNWALVISRFVRGLPIRYQTATKDAQLCGVVVEIDDRSAKALGIQRIEVKE